MYRTAFKGMFTLGITGFTAVNLERLYQAQKSRWEAQELQYAEILRRRKELEQILETR